MDNREIAIERIVQELTSPGDSYKNILVVAADHPTLSVFFDEVWNDLRETGSGFEASRSMQKLRVGQRTAHFITASEPERVMGFSNLALLVKLMGGRRGCIPFEVRQTLRVYSDVPTIAFSG